MNIHFVLGSTLHYACVLHLDMCISRVPEHNGISLVCYIVMIYYFSQEPSICSAQLSMSYMEKHYRNKIISIIIIIITSILVSP